MILKKAGLLVIFIFFLYLLMVVDRVPLIFQSPEDAYADFLNTTDQAEDMLKGGDGVRSRYK